MHDARALSGLALCGALLVAACFPISAPAPTSPPPAATATQRVIGGAARPIVIAFMPSADPADIEGARAVAGALEAGTGLRWEASVPASFADAIDGMCAGQVDLALLSALALVHAADRNCGTVLLGALRPDGSGRLATTHSGQLLVRRGSGFADLDSLRGRAIAFSDRSSPAGHLFVKLLVREATGEEPQTFFSESIFSGGDAAAVTALYRGTVDAAAARTGVRREMAEELPDILEVTERIATVGPVPNEVVAIRVGFPAALRDEISAALAAYAGTPAGRDALAALYGIEGLDGVDGTLFDRLREAATLAEVDLADEAARTARPAPTASP